MSAISRTLLALAMFLAVLPASARSECTRWDAVLPIVGEADGAMNLQRVVVAGAWALAIDETGYNLRTLRVYSLHDPEAPVLVASRPLPHGAEAIRCQDDLLYVAGGDTLAVYDVHTPAEPSLLGRLAVPGGIADLDVEGDLCALAVEDFGLVLVDVTDPAFLSIAGDFATPNWQGEPSSVDLRDGRAILGLDDLNDGYFYWFDVDDPAAPIALASLAYDRPIIQVQLVDDQPLVLATSSNSLVSLAVSDTGPIEILSVRAIAGDRLLRFDGLALSMYFHTGDSMLLEFSEPTASTWLAPLERFAFDAAQKSQYLILARGGSGLGVAQISDPAEVPIVGIDDEYIGQVTLYATPDPTLVLELDPGLDRARLVDVSDPEHPYGRGTLLLEDPSWASVQGSRALIVTATGPRMVDLSDPDLLVAEGTVSLPEQTIRVTWTEGRYYVGAGSDGLVIMDAANELQPVELGRLETSGSVRNVALLGTVAVIGDNAGGIKTVDISDPTAPVALGQVTGVHGDLLVIDGTRCFAGGWLGDVVAEVDLSDPTFPAIAASIPLTAWPNALLVTGGLLWTTTYDGVDVFDITTPGDPETLAVLRGQPRANGLAPVADGVATGMWLFAVLRPPCHDLTAVREPVVTVAASTLRAVPNPCNPTTQLSFTVPRAAPCRLDLHDLAGRRVRVLWDGWLEGGPHTFTWDGRTGSGRAVASGVYLARLLVPEMGTLATARIVLVR